MTGPGSSDLVEFRAEVRSWLGDNFPRALAKDQAAQMADAHASTASSDDQRIWKDRMVSRGWGAPTWPVQYGGGGLSPAQALVLQEEMASIGALNPIAGMGLLLFGPTLLEYGTDEQKARYLPDITAGRVRWCQGYSEPGAGSDLASLQTKAEDKGDHFLVNGQKIWTSGAHHSDMIFCLVRTDPAKKHEGISFLVFSMRQPGVEARPIALIAGNSPFCETFFTDVRVPKEDLIGPLNGGWTVGKRLLQFERSSQGGRAGGAAGEAKGEPLGVKAKRYVGEDEQGRLADHDLRTRIVLHEMDERAVQLTTRRAVQEARGNRGPSATTSIMKNATVRVLQGKAELMIEVMGHQGLGWEGAGFDDAELQSVRDWLSGRAISILGGSHEVQNNIISKRILGLPDASSET